MFKRFARPRALILMSGLLLATACNARSATPAPFTEGTEYVTLPAPHQRYSSEGKVEVVEVFSYGCVHCAHFAPVAAALARQLPKDVAFKLLPAPFNAEWVPFARAFYAAKQLGVLERTHLALFDAKFEQQYPINSMDELANFYVREGVDRAAFMTAATSPQTTAQMKADLALLQKWQVDGTPTIVINGKYRVAAVHTYDEMVAVTQWLVKRELATK